MLDPELIRSRRSAYAVCLTDVSACLRQAQILGKRSLAEAYEERLWILLWAQHVVCSYQLEGEECTGQWSPTDEQAMCAIAKADPDCVKCACPTVPDPGNTIPPSWPCNIVADAEVVRARDASSYLANAPLTYVVSNVLGVVNPWSTKVGRYVITMGGMVVPVGTVATGMVTYATQDAAHWIQTASGPGAYFPDLIAQVNLPGVVTVRSKWPHVNAIQGFDVLVEARVNGAWVTLHDGADPYAIEQNYSVDAIPDILRWTYKKGTCNYGPYMADVGGGGEPDDETSHDTGFSHSDAHG